MYHRNKNDTPIDGTNQQVTICNSKLFDHKHSLSLDNQDADAVSGSRFARDFLDQLASQCTRWKRFNSTRESNFFHSQKKDKSRQNPSRISLPLAGEAKATCTCLL